MIKINWFKSDIKDEYSKEIEKVIHEKYRIYGENIDDDIKKEVFLNNNEYSSDKVRKFICMTFDEIMGNSTFTKYISDHNILNKSIKEKVNNNAYKSWKKNQDVNISKLNYLNHLLCENNMEKLPDKDVRLKTFKDFKAYLVSLDDPIKAYLVSLDDPISAVFNYQYMSDLINMRDKLMISLNIDVCPYCNRQYITSWRKSKDQSDHSTADLDHFFPKDIYPLFSLSLFNFVPSCQICNSRMKGKDFIDKEGYMPVYPYKEGFGDSARFIIDEEKVNQDTLLNIWLGKEIQELKIKLDIAPSCNNKKNIEQSNSLYHIEEVYQSHRRYVSELILKKRIFENDGYVQNIKNILEEKLSTLMNTYDMDEYLKYFLYGYDWTKGEDANRTLSKLTYDILNFYCK